MRPGKDQRAHHGTPSRLRAKYLQHLPALGRAHEAEGRWEEAVSWYGREIEADELVEAFYQRLIRCYQHLGRTAEARATGERCRRLGRRTRDPAIGRDPGLDQNPRALAGALRPARRRPRRPRRVFLPSLIRPSSRVT